MAVSDEITSAAAEAYVAEITRAGQGDSVRLHHNKATFAAIEAAVKAEREACAKTAESFRKSDGLMSVTPALAKQIAAAIRAR